MLIWFLDGVVINNSYVTMKTQGKRQNKFTMQVKVSKE